MNPITRVINYLRGRKHPVERTPDPLVAQWASRPAIRRKLAEQKRREDALGAALGPKTMILRIRRRRARKGVNWTPERK